MRHTRRYIPQTGLNVNPTIQHYNDVIMGAIASQITRLTIFLLNRLFRRRSKKTSKLRVTGLCAGNSTVTGEFPAQMASNAENVSIWWRHHGVQSMGTAVKIACKLQSYFQHINQFTGCIPYIYIYSYICIYIYTYTYHKFIKQTWGILQQNRIPKIIYRVYIWMSNYTIRKQWIVMTHPFPTLNGGLAKSPFRLGHGWGNASHKYNGCTYLSIS